MTPTDRRERRLAIALFAAALVSTLATSLAGWPIAERAVDALPADTLDPAFRSLAAASALIIVSVGSLIVYGILRATAALVDRALRQPDPQPGVVQRPTTIAVDCAIIVLGVRAIVSLPFPALATPLAAATCAVVACALAASLLRFATRSRVSARSAIVLAVGASLATTAMTWRP